MQNKKKPYLNSIVKKAFIESPFVSPPPPSPRDVFGDDYTKIPTIQGVSNPFGAAKSVHIFTLCHVAGKP